MAEDYFLAVVLLFNTIWTGWLQFKNNQLEASLRNLCKECEYEFTPRKKN
jgi:hypothetical protein